MLWNNEFAGVDGDPLCDFDDQCITHIALPEYTRTIVESKAYTWLISGLQREASIRLDRHDSTMNRVRQEILRNLTTSRISQERPPEQHWVTFLLKFPCERVAEKQIGELTVATYCSGDAQVASVKQYMDQIWGSGCKQLLDLVAHAGNDPDSDIHDGTCTLPDKSELHAKFHGSSLTIRVRGPRYTIAECGEQLAWLAAATKPPVSNGSSHHVPFIVHREHGRQPKRPIYADEVVRFDIRVSQIDAQASWEGLFSKGLVVVHGFPIHKRPEMFSGVEIPWNIIPSLTNVTRMHVPSEGIFLKLRKETFQLTRGVIDTFLWQCLFHQGPSNKTTKWTDQKASHQLASQDAEFNREDKSLLGHDDYHSIHISEARGFNHRRHIFNLGGHLSIGGQGLEFDKSTHTRTSTPDSNYNIQSGKPLPSFTISSLLEDNTTGHIHQDSTENFSRVEQYLEDLNINGQAQAMPGVEIQSSADCSDRSDSPDISIDSEFLSMSEPSDDVDLPDLNAVQLRTIRSSAVRLVSRYRQAANGNTISSRIAESTLASTPFNEGQTPHQSCRSQVERTHRDQSGLDSDEEGDDEDGPTRPRKESKQSRRDRGHLSLACPYWKSDVNKYRGCLLKLTRLRDVKQHLVRKHVPKHSCQSCKLVFTREGDLQTHISQEAGLTCGYSSGFPEGYISPKQERKLSQRSNVNLPEHEQWFVIWDLIFRGQKQPPSAYVDSSLSADLSSYLEHCQLHEEDVLFEELRNSGVWEGSAIGEDQIRRCVRRVIDEGRSILFEQWRSARVPDFGTMGPGLNSTHQTASVQQRSSMSGTTTSSQVDSGVFLHSHSSQTMSQPESSSRKGKEVQRNEDQSKNRPDDTALPLPLPDLNQTQFGEDFLSQWEPGGDFQEMSLFPNDSSHQGIGDTDAIFQGNGEGVDEDMAMFPGMDWINNESQN